MAVWVDSSSSHVVAKSSIYATPTQHDETAMNKTQDKIILPHTEAIVTLIL